QKHGRPEIVDAGVVSNLVHALAHAHVRDEVINSINAFQSASDSLRFPNVADHQFDVPIEIARPLALRPMHLGRKIVQDAYGISFFKQLGCDVRSNEPRSAGDENALTHLLSLQTLKVFYVSLRNA